MNLQNSTGHRRSQSKRSCTVYRIRVHTRNSSVPPVPDPASSISHVSSGDPGTHSCADSSVKAVHDGGCKMCSCGVQSVSSGDPTSNTWRACRLRSNASAEPHNPVDALVAEKHCVSANISNILIRHCIFGKVGRDSISEYFHSTVHLTGPIFSLRIKPYDYQSNGGGERA